MGRKWERESRSKQVIIIIYRRRGQNVLQGKKNSLRISSVFSNPWPGFLLGKKDQQQEERGEPTEHRLIIRLFSFPPRVWYQARFYRSFSFYPNTNHSWHQAVTKIWPQVSKNRPPLTTLKYPPPTHPIFFLPPSPYKYQTGTKIVSSKESHKLVWPRKRM